MIHNFTQESHSNVCQFFAAINPDANDRVIALAQQFRSKHSRALARIGGSGFVDSIIREHSRMASVKRSARQQIDAVFSHMVAADIPYGEATLSGLGSINGFMAALMNALNIANDDVETGGVRNLDGFVGMLASLGTLYSDSGYGRDKNDDEVFKQLKALLDDAVDNSTEGQRNFKEFKKAIQEMGNYSDYMDDATRKIYESLQDRMNQLKNPNGLTSKEWNRYHLFNTSIMLRDTYNAGYNIANDTQSDAEKQYYDLVKNMSKSHINNGCYYTLDQITNPNGNVFSNPYFHTIANDKKINFSFDNALGESDRMTNEDWQEYSRFVSCMEKQNRIIYSYDYSAKMKNGVIYTDCWGIQKIGATLTLNSSAMENNIFRKVDYMAKDFKKAGTLTEVGKNKGIDVKQLTEDDYVFIDNDDHKPEKDQTKGYDHIYKVVYNLPDKDDPSKVYQIGLLSIGGKKEGIQTFNAETWSNDQKKHKMAYGYQPYVGE